MEHLYDKLIEYSSSDAYPYHMPGHKRRLSEDNFKQIYAMDITEIHDFDNLHQPEGIIYDLQEKAGKVFGADKTYFLVNGSTVGILTAISAVIPEKGHFLMARNCHKSAYHGAYLRKLKISYIYPQMVEGFDICEAITLEDVREVVSYYKEKGQKVDGVLIVSPTYEGRIAEVEEIAVYLHENGIPLIVDEAHGAHLGLVEGYARNSNQQGADVVIQSIHKTLPAMTQTALLHINGGLVDRKRVERFLHIYQSSSPSYVLMASIDHAIHIIEEKADILFSEFKLQYATMLLELMRCECFRFLPLTDKQDVGKLVIDCRNANISGNALQKILRDRFALELEMACELYCLAMFTIGDSEEAYKRMTEALLILDKEFSAQKINVDEYIAGEHIADEHNLQNRKKMNNNEIRYNLSEAWDMAAGVKELSLAEGKIAAEFVNLYPPGVPILVPGEVITKEIIFNLKKCLNKGFEVQGIERKDEIYYINCIEE